ncbi:MAG: hypothetical protein CSA04_02835 [Bacteroidetes bacterium]|nr:MAG: hypothetical protein CSA04_02835 [Bacteroidota bacterium]
MSDKTSQQYETAMSHCRSVFQAKARDYGCAWRVLRPSSLTDQIYIKANRIKNIQGKGTHKIDEGIEPEFIGIVNYAIMALIQCDLGVADRDDLPPEKVMQHYDHYAHESKVLMESKNHDYGEAWRNMRVSSLDDIILMKLLRIKRIEDNHGAAEVSEGVEAGYFDIVNYAVFALIKLMEANMDVKLVNV